MTLPRITLSGPKGTGKDELAEAFRRRGFAIVALADPIKVIARDVWGCDPADLWGPSERRETAVKDAWVWSCAQCCAQWPRVNGLSPSPTSTPFFGCPSCDADLHAVPLTIRRLLQYLGTEVGRGIDPQAWVRALERRIAGVDCWHSFLTAPWNGRDSHGTYWPAAMACAQIAERAFHQPHEVRPRGIVTPDWRFDNEARALPHVVGLRREGVAWGSEHASEVGVNPTLLWRIEAIPYLPDAAERQAFYDGLAARLVKEIP